MSAQFLDADRLATLLRQLAHRLHDSGVDAHLYVVGGAALVMAYALQRATDDVDALVSPRQAVLEHSRRLAAEQDLPPDWLNDAVRHVMPPHPDDHPRTVLELAGLSVSVASPSYLLAMKSMTSRQSDVDLADSAHLCRLLGITDERQLEAIIHRYFGPAPLGATELWLEDIITAARAAPLTDTARAATLGGACGHWMPRAKRLCHLSRGHRGQHH